MVRHMRRAGPKPRYVWVPGNDQGVTTAAASTGASADLLANYLNDAQRDTGPGMVVERIIGSFTVTPPAPALQDAFMAGLMVVPEGGLTSRPAAKTEIARFLWYIADETRIDASETAATVFGPTQNKYYFDVSSRQRLVNMGDELQLMFQNDTAEDILTWSIYTRTLLRVT